MDFKDNNYRLGSGVESAVRERYGECIDEIKKSIDIKECCHALDYAFEALRKSCPPSNNSECILWSVDIIKGYRNLGAIYQALQYDLLEELLIRHSELEKDLSSFDALRT